MDLDKLARIILQKRKEFEDAVSEEAKGLRFEDLTAVMEPDSTWIWYYLQRDFKDGQTLEFHPCQHFYRVSIDRQELVVRSSHDIEVARFTGKKVEKFYAGLSAAIKKAQEEEVIPF